MQKELHAASLASSRLYRVSTPRMLGENASSERGVQGDASKCALNWVWLDNKKQLSETLR